MVKYSINSVFLSLNVSTLNLFGGGHSVSSGLEFLKGGLGGGGVYS